MRQAFLYEGADGCFARLRACLDVQQAQQHDGVLRGRHKPVLDQHLLARLTYQRCNKGNELHHIANSSISRMTQMESLA